MDSQETITHQKLFFRQFIEDFYHVGAVLPSSRALARAGAVYLSQKQGPVCVLEAGAGTGPFTREIIPLLKAGDRFDVVEINSQLIGYLQQRFRYEPAFQPEPGVRVQLINGDIRTLRPKAMYDYIIFALPLTNFPPAMVEEILGLMIACLKPGGVFSYIKYIFIGRLKYLFGGREVRQEMEANQALIEGFARQYQIERRAVLWNIPPAWVYYWRKPDS